jgi:hypothetical protein
MGLGWIDPSPIDIELTAIFHEVSVLIDGTPQL